MKNKLLALLVLHLGLAAVVAQPVITNQPQNQTNIAGTTAMFTVGATGAQPLSYQWRSHANSSQFTNIPFGTEATLLLTNVQSTSRRFAVVVTDAGSLSATSSPLVTLTAVAPPTITPANPTASLFADVTLLATNVAAGAISYQWLLNGEPIAGAVTNKLVVSNVQKTNAGNYAIVTTYAFGSATSLVATLKIVPFNSMYWFGFSWTDSQTIRHGCATPSACPSCFWQGRYSNGPRWPEILSANLGLAYVEANNYAVCGADAVEMLVEVNRLPIPPKPASSLYFHWLNYDDVPPAATNRAAWDSIIQSQMLSSSNLVHALYLRGARQIVLHEVFDLSKLPLKFPEIAYFGTNAAGLASYSEFKRRCNEAFREVTKTFSRTRPDLRIVWVDIFAKLNDVLANPAEFGFTETTIGALDDAALTDKSFTGPGADYVFWNNAHPTAKLHNLIARWTLEALTNAAPETLEASLSATALKVEMNHLLIGRDYTLQTSSDLANWNDVQTFTASAGTNQVSQALETGTRSAFYRLQWQQ